MTDRIVIPSEDQNGLKAILAEHFGRAPYFTVVDFDAASDNGTGFVFHEYDADAMLTAIRRAIEFFKRKRPWMKLLRFSHPWVHAPGG